MVTLLTNPDAKFLHPITVPPGGATIFATSQTIQLSELPLGCCKFDLMHEGTALSNESFVFEVHAVLSQAVAETPYPIPAGKNFDCMVPFDCLDLPAPRATMADLYGTWYVKAVPIKEILKRVSAFVPLSRHLINVGAHNGQACDPTYTLVKHWQYAGIMFEPRADLMDILQSVLPQDNISKIETYVNPDNIQLWLDNDPNFRKDVDVVKVDIDSYDCDLLGSLLRVANPKVINLETSFQFPPPIEFAKHFDRAKVGWQPRTLQHAACTLLTQCTQSTHGPRCGHVCTDMCVGFDL